MKWISGFYYRRANIVSVPIIFGMERKKVDLGLFFLGVTCVISKSTIQTQCDTEKGTKKDRCLSSSVDICVWRGYRNVFAYLCTQNARTRISMQFEYVICVDAYPCPSVRTAHAPIATYCKQTNKWNGMEYTHEMDKDCFLVTVHCPLQLLLQDICHMRRRQRPTTI